MYICNICIMQTFHVMQTFCSLPLLFVSAYGLKTDVSRKMTSNTRQYLKITNSSYPLIYTYPLLYII